MQPERRIVVLERDTMHRFSTERILQREDYWVFMTEDPTAAVRVAAVSAIDLVLVDLARSQTLTNAMMRSRCGWTPFDGLEVTGWPVATILRGSIVMRDGAIQGTPQGRKLRFLETLETTGA